MEKIHQQSISKAWIYRVLCCHGVVGCVMVMCIGPEVRGMCWIFLKFLECFSIFSDFFRMKEKFTEFFECPLHGVCVCVCVCVEEAPSDEAPRGHE